MEYHEAPAPPDLSDLVHCFWYLRGIGGTVQPVVPDGRSEIVIHVGEPFALLDADGVPCPQAEVVVAGQLTKPLLIQPSSEPEIVGIRFTSTGACAFLGVVMSELTDRTTALRDLRPVLADRLRDAASGVRTLHSFRDVADAIRRVARPRTSLVTQEALVRLDTTSLPTIATHCGVTERTLQRRFRHDVGISPKLMARIIRFRQAYRLLTGPAQPNPVRIAIRSGYYDQPHLINDFRRFAGESPGQFFRHTTDLSDAFLTNDLALRPNPRTEADSE